MAKRTSIRYRYRSVFGSTHNLTNRLVSRVVPHLKVWVIECLLAADAFGWVKAKHLHINALVTDKPI